MLKTTLRTVKPISRSSQLFSAARGYATSSTESGRELFISLIAN
jgi:hypothetical protein